MILTKLSRQPTSLPSCRAIASTKYLYNPKAIRRRLHNVPQLTHGEAFSENGVGHALSSQGFRIAWHEYQTHLVTRLNEMTAGRPDENKGTRDILLATARNPNQASLFNHASMAWNKHHFFTTLSPNPRPLGGTLKENIEKSFSSLESFRKQFMATAMGMFGPGFVWLIHNPHAKTDPNDPPLTILCTYIAGSPLPGAHPRAQTVDMTTMNALTGQRGVGNIGPHSLSRESQIPPGRMTTAEICLGVCTWEHVWNHDHGVSTEAKEQYLKEWWKCVDWKVVEDYASFGKSQLNFTTKYNMRGSRY